MSDRPFFSMPYPGIFRVTCPTPFPGLPHVHAYLAEGPQGGVVLIDTTLGFEGSFDRVEQAVRWMDRDLSDVETIYLTHAHPDHVGLAARLCEASGAPAVCHPIAEQGLDAMATGERWQEIAAHYVEHGRDPETPREPSFTIPKPARLEHIEAGDHVTFAGSSWQVHWTPGHEWGHVAFFRPGDRLLISGDTLLGKITPHIGYTIEPSDPLGQFLESLDALAALEPSLVLPGHGRPFEEGAERARVIRAHHEQRLRRTIEILARRGPTHALDVSRELFGRDLMFFQERLAMAETLAHLEHLRLTGRLERDLTEGVWHYHIGKVVP